MPEQGRWSAPGNGKFGCAVIYFAVEYRFVGAVGVNVIVTARAGMAKRSIVMKYAVLGRDVINICSGSRWLLPDIGQ